MFRGCEILYLSLEVPDIIRPWPGVDEEKQGRNGTRKEQPGYYRAKN